jgi:3-dehydroquinate synthase class II
MPLLYALDGRCVLTGCASCLLPSQCLESAYINSRPFRVRQRVPGCGAQHRLVLWGAKAHRWFRAFSQLLTQGAHISQPHTLCSVAHGRLQAPPAAAAQVNAGAVHAYVQMPEGRTAYLSELRSGAEVLVADAAGRTSTAIVGRVKVESRPLVSVLGRRACGSLCARGRQTHARAGGRLGCMPQLLLAMLVPPFKALRYTGRDGLSGRAHVHAQLPQVLVEAEAPNGDVVSTLMQNAETVRLVGPSTAEPRDSASAPGHTDGRSAAWRAVSVSELVPGDDVHLLQQEGARHTGISIQESIVEK